MTWFKTSVAVLAITGLGLTSCASLGRAAGSGKSKPDEFRVLTKAPLEIPPEYNLLPPRPGEPRPQDLAASHAARIAILGGDGSASSTVGEQVFIARARGDLTDNSIRAQLDSETNRQTTKSNSFADRILFWRGGDTYVEDGTMLDADAEAERIRRKELGDSATGGGEVVIRKAGRSRIKLPGL
ncbi:hypothetical protein MNBD_GAMMA15-790 [hydrothermal vent metagenome]|uniref:DUF3035 domain-containing protein n=2 Tax=hydrothermal vent metagenome TaxID=652676 RepID=A0A3B0YIT8_9ZZZZ